MATEREPYRIPKKIHTRMLIMGLNMKGLMAMGGVILLGLAQFYILPIRNYHTAIPRVVITFFIFGLTYLVLSNPFFMTLVRQSIYHRKHAATLVWRSDRYAILDNIAKEKKQ